MVTKGQIINLGASGVTITIIQTAAETNGEFVQMESMMQPAKRLPTLAHIHPAQQEKIEVLSGELTTSLNGALTRLHAGDSITIRAGELHNFWNDSNEMVHFRVEHRPALRLQDFMETMGNLVKNGSIKYDGSFSDKLQMAVVVNKFSDTLVLPQPKKFVIRLLGGIGKLLGKGKNLND
jgi:quercetin dioxygenase-like cupin family protein